MANLSLAVNAQITSLQSEAFIKTMAAVEALMAAGPECARLAVIRWMLLNEVERGWPTPREKADK